MSTMKNSFEELEVFPSEDQMERLLRAASDVEKKVNQIKSDLIFLKKSRDKKESEYLYLDSKIRQIEYSISQGIPNNESYRYLENEEVKYNLDRGIHLSSEEIEHELQALKFKLISQIGADELEDAFSLINDKVVKSSSLFIEVNLLKSQYSRVSKLIFKSLINYKEYLLEVNRISRSFTEVILDIDNSSVFIQD